MLDKHELESIHETIDKVGDLIVHAIFIAEDDAALQEALRQYLRHTSSIEDVLAQRISYHEPGCAN